MFIKFGLKSTDKSNKELIGKTYDITNNKIFQNQTS